MIKSWIDATIDHKMILSKDDPMLPVLQAQKEKIQSDFIDPINTWARDQGVPYVRGEE